MRATVMHGAGDVRVETVPDASLAEPTDAVVRVTRACICGSDLWPYKSLPPTEPGRRMGHEAIGVVEEVGADVRTVRPGDLVMGDDDGVVIVPIEKAEECLRLARKSVLFDQKEMRWVESGRTIHDLIEKLWEPDGMNYRANKWRWVDEDTR